MTATLEPSTTGLTPGPPGRRRRWVPVAVAGVLAAAGLGVGFGLSLGHSSHSAAAPAGTAYDYYRSVMGGLGLGAGSMMGGSGYSWMMGPAGYGWMFGGTQAPGWMAGSNLPGFMMGSSADPGERMGSLFANAPGTRVSTDQAAKLAEQIPAGATVSRGANRIAFNASAVSFTVVASPPGADDHFAIAGLTDPDVVVPMGAKVTVTFVNADATSAHGLVFTAAGASRSWMPMMTAAPVFAGAATWFLGDATTAGAPTSTLTFTATTAGDYQYVCPVPGHAQKGMAGAFAVRA